MSQSVFVRDDGYTVPTRVGESRGMGAPVHGELNFERRPSTTDFVSDFMQSVEGKKERDHAIYTAKVIAIKIVSWDARDENGDPAPITPEWVLKLHPLLFRRLRSIICFASESGDEILGQSLSEAGDDLLGRLQKNSQTDSVSSSNTPDQPESTATTVSDSSTT